MLSNGLKRFFQDKQILITGGTGTIGTSLVHFLMKCEPAVIRIISNDEFSIFQLEQSLGEQSKESKLRFLAGDIRDLNRLILATEGIDIVFHAAALKHVPLCEYNPFEAIKTNVLGTQNLIEACLANNVKNFIGISTDKAVNPFNTMGATKLLSEKLIINANFYKGHKDTLFSCVRFGNVLDSRGSILPTIRNKIEMNQPIMLTHPEMTRFVMTINQATSLVLKAVELAHGGEIFVFKMPSLRIKDLIEAAIEMYSSQLGKEKYDHKIIETDIRLGEKIHEDLLSPGEAARIYETENLYIIIPHVTMERADEVDYTFPEVELITYNSGETEHMTSKEIKQLLKII